MKKRFSEEQIIGFLREAEAGMAVKDLCRRHGFSEASYYLWRSKFGGMSVPEAKRLKELEAENIRLKKLPAEQMFENDVIKDALRKSGDRTGQARAGAASGGQYGSRMRLGSRSPSPPTRTISRRRSSCGRPVPRTSPIPMAPARWRLRLPSTRAQCRAEELRRLDAAGGPRASLPGGGKVLNKRR